MFDVVGMGELLIDFTPSGVSAAGMDLYERNPGGAPANVLAAVNRLGGTTAFIGKVGDDMHGAFLRETLEKADIDTTGLITDDRFFTTLAFVSLKNGERDFSFARKPGADTQLSKEEVKEELLRNTRIFHCGSLSLTDEPAKEATYYAVEQAKKAGALISYDPNYRAPLWCDVETAKKEMRSMVPYADIMKISDEETELLSGYQNPLEAARELLKQGPACVIVTLGADGAILATKDLEIHVPTGKCQVVDTTGAGDAFWGGLLFCFSKNQTDPRKLTKEQAEEYLHFANTVAGICVEKRGAIPAMPSMEDVKARL